jgi:glutamine amidotransferase
MIAILDYGMGNVCSVEKALDYLGAEACLTADERKLADASHLILPGVGAFGDAMQNLRACGLVEILARQVFEKGKPLLGICLGLQLLARSSTEHGLHEGLGWIAGKVERFELDESSYKIPHMGWNDITPAHEHPLLAGLTRGQRDFYFVHSFHIRCDDAKDEAAYCEYGYRFTAAVARDNIFAVQFHPEKSQDNGLQVLRNFLDWNP